MAIDIFLSVGRPFTTSQETFIASIESFLSQSGLRPHTVGRTALTHNNPLDFVAHLMDRSAGALVIALERISIERGVERRGGTGETIISNSALPTPWNQIEAAFAYAKGIPLLVIKENSVRADGLLEGRYDWYVHSTALDPSFLSSSDFRGIFDSWHGKVRRRASLSRFRS